MSWDPALVRKYTTTSHLKLLGQVRSELREQPIQRPLVTSRSQATASPRRGSGRSQQDARQPSDTRSAQDPPSLSTTHNVTRRRSTAPAVVSAPVREEHHQPIVAVPVLVDPALHEHP